ncbi:hypothetical protein J2755_001207 [Methanohalophilus levihalophilus]|uniref:hypothetical protein n=1 Tax=Methanohalophilus levihalophilus TaxID=1431282 RepID=UPI001AE50771|nr:hypothetical protein [Methanohalophilus levihalophilus]MBP2030273.1 hypothetical protein [Methanohalophilus levihalophilus]
MIKVQYKPGCITITYGNEDSAPEMTYDENGITISVSKNQIGKSGKQYALPTESVSEKDEQDIIIPEIDEIIKFIVSKNDFLHDNAAIHNHFFGRPLSSRNDKEIYQQTISLIRQAREFIADKYNGVWVEEKKKTGNRRFKAYRFKKNTSNNNPVITF